MHCFVFKHNSLFGEWQILSEIFDLFVFRTVEDANLDFNILPLAVKLSSQICALYPTTCIRNDNQGDSYLQDIAFCTLSLRKY